MAQGPPEVLIQERLPCRIYFLLKFNPDEIDIPHLSGIDAIPTHRIGPQGSVRGYETDID
jgi:hypothetical protein